MTREEFKAKAKEVVDNEPFGDLGVLFDYESFAEMRVALIQDGLESADADMPLDEFLGKLYDKCRECEKQKTRWIPCSERLPEEEGDYLLWGKVCEDEEGYQFIGSYDSGCEQFGVWQEQFDRTTLGCLGSEFFEYASVIAWQPLPKPYKEKESEE